MNPVTRCKIQDLKNKWKKCHFTDSSDMKSVNLTRKSVHIFGEVRGSDIFYFSVPTQIAQTVRIETPSEHHHVTQMLSLNIDVEKNYENSTSDSMENERKKAPCATRQTTVIIAVFSTDDDTWRDTVNDQNVKYDTSTKLIDFRVLSKSIIQRCRVVNSEWFVEISPSERWTWTRQLRGKVLSNNDVKISFSIKITDTTEHEVARKESHCRYLNNSQRVIVTQEIQWNEILNYRTNWCSSWLKKYAGWQSILLHIECCLQMLPFHCSRFVLSTWNLLLDESERNLFQIHFFETWIRQISARRQIFVLSLHDQLCNPPHNCRNPDDVWTDLRPSGIVV